GLYAFLLLVILALSGYVLWRRYQSRRALVARLAELNHLAELGRALQAAQLDSKRLAELVYRQATDIVDTTFFQLGLFEGDRYRMLIWIYDGQPRPVINVQLTPDSLGIVGWVRQRRESLIIRDFEAERDKLPAQPRYISPDPPRSAVFVPVLAGERCLGALAIQSRRPHAFSEEHLRLLTIIANNAAAVLENARLYEQAQQRAAQLQLLAEVSRRINVLQPLPDFYRQAVDLVSAEFGEYLVNLFTLEEQELRLAATTRTDWQGREIVVPVGAGVVGQAAEWRQTFIAQTWPEDEDVMHADQLAEIAVPLVIEEQVLGVLNAQSKTAHFDDAVRSLFESLAAQIAFATLEARVYARERTRAQQLTALAQASRFVVSSLDIEQVLDSILTELERVVKYDVASVLWVNEDGQMTLQAARGPQSLALINELGAPVPIRVFPRGEAPASVAFDAVDTDNAYHHLLELPTPHACLGAPLVVQQEHLGYLVLDRIGQSAFPPHEEELVTAFASQASIALENARLFSAQREEAWVSTALLQVAEAIAQTAHLEDALATLAQVTTMLGGVQWCLVLLAEGEVFYPRAMHALDELTVPALEHGLTVAEWPQLGELLQTQDAVVVEPNSPAPEMLQPLLAGVTLLLPLWVKGQVQGALVIGESSEAAPFSAHQVNLLGGIANQASIALESALHEEARQEEAYVNTALLQVAEAVASQPTLDEALETVARLTPILVGLERVAIYRWNAEDRFFRPSRCIGFTCDVNELTATASELEIDPFTPATQPVLVLTPPEKLQQSFGAERLMVWPLWARGELLGALAVEHLPDLGRRLNILNGIANQLSLAMENAALAHEVAAQQRLEREIELGRDIQTSFLPNELPMPPGWETAALYRAARLVGGDFYDFIPLKSSDGVERWGIAVADVSDKGVPAALFMALSRTLLRSAAIHRTSAGATLTRVNEMILADARSSQFVTVFYAVWEPSTGRLIYANGGHNPPLLVRADGSVHLLKAKGAALAVFAEYYYAQQEITLAPGDTVLMYSDGLPDAINEAQEDFGMERLRQTLLAVHRQSAGTIISALEAAVQHHTGDVEAFDDLTVVVLKRL
ncbi:MAG: SpoIIE family protein phosphatase, partial [Anaerolineales bacterium]|nr:SpoIIE family protein phosphatase [Anaerolineales bacterium]